MVSSSAIELQTTAQDRTATATASRSTTVSAQETGAAAAPKMLTPACALSRRSGHLTAEVRCVLATPRAA